MQLASCKKWIVMKYLSLKTNKKTLVRSLMFFVFILASNTSVIAQAEKNTVVENVIESIPAAKIENSATVSSSNTMNFVLWFMGSKQDLKSTISSESVNTKKQVIISGTAPNRLLMKAFLKKAVNLDSTIA